MRIIARIDADNSDGSHVRSLAIGYRSEGRRVIIEARDRGIWQPTETSRLRRSGESAKTAAEDMISHAWRSGWGLQWRVDGKWE